jgi:hypothetical protein
LKYCECWQQDAKQPQAGWIDAAELKLAMFSTISWLPMERILANADFQMTGADSRVNDQGDEVVRIVYRYTAEASSDYLLQPDGIYWAELRPRRFWVVVRSGMTSSMTKHVDTDGPFRERMTIRYQVSGMGWSSLAGGGSGRSRGRGEERRCSNPRESVWAATSVLAADGGVLPAALRVVG